ncbi:MAG: DNA repair protein RadC [Bacteroidota bacterium]
MATLRDKPLAAVTYHSKITDWPKNERPREKLLRHGAENLSEAELLAILIRTGSGSMTAVDIAKKLLTDFDSLPNLAARTPQEFMDVHGIKSAKAITLVAAFELGRRAASNYNEEKMQVVSPMDIVNRYQSLMRNLNEERFKVILLNSANHIIGEKEISRGLLNSSLAHPREVFRHAITAPAASVILLHNHPSGNPEPSSEDIQITKQIVEASKVVGIPVHDHIIIAGNSFTSFAERGLL